MKWTFLCLSLVILIILFIVMVRCYFSRYQLEPFIPHNKITRRIDLLDNLKTGDLVLFRWEGYKPKGYGMEVFANELRGAVPSHIGLLLKKENGKLYCVESTIWDWASGKVPCIYEPGKKQGTKVCDFEEMVRIYPGQIFVRKLNKPLSQSMVDKLDKLVQSHIGGDFDMSIRNVSGGVSAIGLYDLGMRGLASKWRKWVKKPGTYCSEYIARLLQNIGVLSENRPDWSYAPYMFTKKSPHNLQIIDGYQYGKEIQLT